MLEVVIRGAGLYYSHPTFGQVRLPSNAATNADFLNYIGQQIC